MTALAFSVFLVDIHSMRTALIVARRAHGLTQEQLAVFVGIDQSTICRIERGTMSPNAKCLALLCEELGLTSSEVLIEEVVVEKHSRDKRGNTTVRGRFAERTCSDGPFCCESKLEGERR
jgi:DNA-binding XRE family transcriptional regulator